MKEIVAAIGLSILVPGCTIALTPQGQNIEYLDQAPPTCKRIEELKNTFCFTSHPDERKIFFRNQAAKATGANSVYTYLSGDGSCYIGRAYQCDPITKESDDSVKNQCFSANSANACLELGYRYQARGTPFEETIKPFSKGCSLKSETACRLEAEYKFKINYQTLSGRCNSGSKDSCVDLMKMHYGKKDIQGTIYWGKLGCLNGADTACKMTAMLIAEIGQAEANRLQIQMQQAAAQQQLMMGLQQAGDQIGRGFSTLRSAPASDQSPSPTSFAPSSSGSILSCGVRPVRYTMPGCTQKCINGSWVEACD